MRYVIKNESGLYASYDYDERKWTWDKSRFARHEFTVFELAQDLAASVGGKVYRVRRATAKSERRAVVKFIDQLSRADTGAIRAVLADVSTRILDGEHRSPK